MILAYVSADVVLFYCDYVDGTMSIVICSFLRLPIHLSGCEVLRVYLCGRRVVARNDTQLRQRQAVDYVYVSLRVIKLSVSHYGGL